MAYPKPQPRPTHIEWFLGFDGDGDPCVYFHFVDDEHGDHVRYLTGTEATMLLKQTPGITEGE